MFFSKNLFGIFLCFDKNGRLFHILVGYSQTFITVKSLECYQITIIILLKKKDKVHDRDSYKTSISN